MQEPIDRLPKHDELFWPVVRAFRQLGGSADNEQLVEKVSELLGIEDELTTILHKAGPQSELSYRIAWVKSWLKWGGIVDNPKRAVWVLTARGRNATQAEVNAVRQRRRAEAARKRKAPQPDAPSALSEDLEPAPASEELDQFADDDWQNELLDIVRSMEPPAFERLARQLLLSLGFSHVEVVGKSGDGGIDLLGIVKINDVLTFRVLVQCKRYKGTVAPKDIRDFRGAMHGRTDKAIYITSGRYSRDARKEASRDGVPEIDLVDGEGLANLLKRLKMGVETRLVEQVIIDRGFFSKV